MSKPVILTGLRANADFHIGNYLGAILPMVKLQKQHAGEYQVNMFVPDLHSFTTPIDHGKLYQNTINNLKVFVAAGLDIENDDTYIYRQSFIPAHSELAWILDCFTYFGEASRMIEFKDKSQKFGHETVSVGQFNYPVLMAADILLYHAKYVPLGDDQQQHLELTRDLAIRLNNKFNDLFTVPEDWKKQLQFTDRTSLRIRSLRNPEKKMSKSVDDPAGTIALTDIPEEAAKKVMGATTDSEAKIKVDWAKQPGISNLIQISSLLSGKTSEAIVKDWEGKSSYGDFKNEVADQVKNFLTDFQAKLAKVDEAKLLQKLEQDEKAMNQIANQTLLKVQKAVGLRSS
ncbi:MAG: tryptophan--tRNA ligase [Candidatus Saccharimonadales bacterium]